MVRPSHPIRTGCGSDNRVLAKSLHEIIRRLKPHLWKANQEAKELLEGDLSCALNLAGGAIGSAMTQNPLIMIWGVSECWMKVSESLK